MPAAQVAEPIRVEPESINEPVSIHVDIKGKVQNPGVYVMMGGDRIMDLIELAGGILSDAEMNYVNLAQKLTDEMVVYIPGIGEEIPEALTVNQAPVAGERDASKINLNSADQAMLETIPGIGPAKAQAIIDYRETTGAFQSIEDIMRISGIGEKTFEKLKDSIVVN
ncbi:helix-hairpin-helix domain-containing protein [Jeotgalibacillus soli]|uniref:Helix-hairpin-helix DNA-binding motif class 1 domain-containing protein n=1 Tax=Jeotgalibacillus soli TaxID=889306 RepID=A0A0C2V663_9BACL|nr:helix-hairpin-helix domain-containing protein [Jeotgalibacillus soli]KIL44472.1 hypothetical protein KP78_34360 [Jeotgalibacillus soli]